MKHLIKGSTVVPKMALFPDQVLWDYRTGVRRNQPKLIRDLSTNGFCALESILAWSRNTSIVVPFNRTNVEHGSFSSRVRPLSWSLLSTRSYCFEVRGFLVLCQLPLIIITPTILPTSIRLIQKERQNLHVSGTTSIPICHGLCSYWERCVST